jgi:hypothetical protein
MLAARCRGPADQAVSILSSTRPGDEEREIAWRRLVESVKGGTCIPFLGAGACEGHILLGAPMAKKWGDLENYPLPDFTNLPRVMQYIATVRYEDATSLKERFVRDELATVRQPNFDDAAQIHGLLAQLDLPLYVTTNYDDFMFQALRHYRKQPKEDHSRWYEADVPNAAISPFTDPSYDPTPAEPLVFHLHGHYRVPKSLVLTEDDYIDYLVRLAGETQRPRESRQTGPGLLPNYVYSSLRTNPLLFIGYSMRDWSFLVLYRILMSGIPNAERRTHVSVQVDPGGRRSRGAREYLEKYLRAQGVQIFWDSAPEFSYKLKMRMEGSGST